MATTTRHLRLDTGGGGGGEDWKQTRIATRVTPPKEPREEKMMMFAKPRNGERKISPPMPLNTGSAQAKRKTIRLVSSSSVEAQRPTSSIVDGKAVREPEIVDLAAPAPSRPRTNRPPPRRAPPPPPPPKRTHSWRKYGVPSTASRQSEMSFGILDYYIHDTEPVSRSPDLALSSGPATVRAVDPAIERFDFGLDERNRVRTPPPRGGGDANSGAEEEEEEMQLVPLSPRPYEEEREKHVVVNECHAKSSEKQHRKTYSLFPAVKDITPSTHDRLVQVYDKPIGYTTPGTRTKAPNTCFSQPKLLPGAEINNANNKTPTTTRQRAGTIDTFSPSTLSGTHTTTTLPSPSYHPRNPSATFNPRTHTRLIPLRILSSSSTSTTNTIATHLTATTSRSSTSTSSPSSTSTHKPLLSSRWSEDTALASPTTAAAVLGGTRASWCSLLGGGVGEGGYPDCFFEDDEEEGEGRPLRRGKGRGKGRGWRGWVCCGMV